MTEMEKFIRDYAASKGLDPEIIMKVVLSEGGRESLEPAGYARQSLVGGAGSPNQEPSFGSFQMHMKHLGGRALAAGIDPRNPADAFKAARFAIDEIARAGLGQWHGWKGDPWAAHGGKASGATVPTPGYTLNSTPLRHVGGAGSGPGFFAQPETTYTPNVDVAGGAPAAAPEEPKTWFEGFKERLGDKDTVSGLTDALTGQTDKGETADQITGTGGDDDSYSTQLAAENTARTQASQALMSSILAGRRGKGVSLNYLPEGGFPWPVQTF